MPGTPLKIGLSRTSDYSRFSFTNNRKEFIDLPEQKDGLLKGGRDTGGGGEKCQNLSKNPNWFYVENDGSDTNEYELLVRCYKRSYVRTFFTYVLTALTVGVARLVFHWVPHWQLKSTCSPCQVNDAQYVLIAEKFKNKHKVYYVKKLKILKPDLIEKSESTEKLENSNTEDQTSVDIDNEIEKKFTAYFGNGEFRSVDQLLMFTCKKTRFIWDTKWEKWTKLKGLDTGVRSDSLHSMQALSEKEQSIRRLVYGMNEIDVPEKTVLALLLLELLNPFYIFQILSFTLWFLDNYYYYALAILIMSAAGIGTAVAQTRRNQRNLRSTIHTSDLATIQRPNATEPFTIPTESLVPGDILEIPPHGCLMHCDAVLLTGNCIVNESMLTGESVPVTKTPLPISNVNFDVKEHARHTLFSGTKVIQTRYYGGEKVLAVVVRTGWGTSKGGLVRSILYPPPVDFRFERDSYRWVFMLAGLAGIGFLYTVVTKAIRGISARDLVLEALDLITIVVPPALPAAMTVGRLYAQRRLKEQNIYCIAPRTINVSGSVNLVCFDKTGTLTEDGLDLLCVVPIRDKFLDIPVKDVSQTMAQRHPTILYGMASCHSLTIIENQVCGDPLDLKMFESTGWVIEEHDTDDTSKYNMMFPTVVKAPKVLGSTEEIDQELQIGIIKEFPFSSSSQRMGVIIRKINGPNFEYYCKGSPEILLNFCLPETVPDDFLNVLAQYTQQGYRVIAIAHKNLKMSYAKVQRAQREVIEKDMTLLGLIVLENRLKPDTTPCVSMLNHASIRCVMVTGDNILTAISVARECSIITPKQSIIVVEVENDQIFYTLNSQIQVANGIDHSELDSSSIVSLETVESAFDNNLESPKTNLNNYRFALTGKVWGILKEKYPELVLKVATRGSVFARMSPEQKQQLVETLQSLGYCVAMCGDGANDCGALRAAHAGISLSDAESSVASPFTSRTSNVSCVPQIIKEGRAALVTSFGIFKYMAAYSLCQFVSVMILYSIDSNLTDIQYLYIDLFMISIFAFFFGKTRAYQGRLVKETPLSSLVSLSPIFSLVLQLCLVIIFQVAALEHTRTETWFTPFNHSLKEEGSHPGCYENYAIFSVSSFQYVILAVAFSKGKPYRESIFSNYGFVLSSIAVMAFSAYLVLYPFDFLRTTFELVMPPEMNFRLILLIYPIINFVFAILAEIFIIDHLVFKKLRFRYHDITKSKKKYLAIEKELQKNVSWPPLSNDFKTSPSIESLIQSPKCETEIVIENENNFDKNHVLTNILVSKGSKNKEIQLDVSGLAQSCEGIVESGNRNNLSRLTESAPSVFNRTNKMSLSQGSVLEMDNISVNYPGTPK